MLDWKCNIHDCELTSHEVVSKRYTTTMIEPEYTEVYYCEKCFDEYAEGKTKSYKTWEANEIYDAFQVDQDIKAWKEDNNG